MTRIKGFFTRTFRSLRVRNYRLYFFGQIVSMSGTWMQSVAQSWLVLQITDSGFALGITFALNFLPMLLVGPWGGLVADRVDKRKLLIWTQFGLATPALALGVLTGLGIVQLWMVYVLALALGCVRVLDNPARHSFVSEMVGPEDVGNAVGLNSTVVTSARIFGPALAGILILAVGIAPCFIINGFTYVAVIVGLVMMNPAELHGDGPVAKGRGQLREGLRYAWSTPELRIPLLLMAVVGTLALNYQILIPLLVRHVYEMGPGTYGLMTSFMGAGAVFGALITASRAAPTTYFLLGSAFALGAGILCVAFAPTLALAMILIVPMGLFNTAFISTSNSTLQLRADPAMRGRVMSLYNMVFLGSTPIGGPLVGFVAERFGARSAFALGGVATLVGAAFAAAAFKRLRVAAEPVVAATPGSEPPATTTLDDQAAAGRPPQIEPDPGVMQDTGEMRSERGERRL